MAPDSNFSITITSGACIYWAILLLVIPLPWAFAWLCAAAFHELSHCVALLLCRKRIEQIHINTHGAQIHTEYLCPATTILCALAGPMGGLLLTGLGTHCPRLTICAMIQTAFNLLPVFPLDGGRALGGILRLLLSESCVTAICKLIGITTVSIFVTLCLIAAFLLRCALLLLLPICVITAIYMERKFSCKWRSLKVQ